MNDRERERIEPKPEDIDDGKTYPTKTNFGGCILIELKR